MAAPNSRKPTGFQHDTLDGGEVLEITLFAEKREWIQDKIEFLSTSLPRIVIHEPLPPLPADATNEDLERWWREHEAIETEVHEYDYGDLTKMRNFAKHKSKQQLSSRDTDLIEVCLTTIFALDRLLSLLSQRRRSLVLLGYRLQWEEALRTVWAAHRQLLQDEIPSFVTKSQYTLPLSDANVTPAEESSSSVEKESAVLSKSLSVSSISSSSSSRSSSTTERRRRLSSLSDHSHSRALRHQTLLLSLSSLKSHLHHLTSINLPASSTLLDKLIDHSVTPLPDAFLDEQDKVEDTIKADFGVNGQELFRWLEQRIENCKNCDDTHRKGTQVEKDSERLTQEVESELSNLSLACSGEIEARMQEWLTRFEERLSQTEQTMNQARTAFDSVKQSWQDTKTPVSVHSSLPHLLADSTTTLLTDLVNLHLRTETALSRSRQSVKKYGASIAAVRRGNRVRGELLEKLSDLQSVQNDFIHLGAPPRDSVRMHDGRPTEQEEEYEISYDALFSSERLDLERTHVLVNEALRTIGDLATAGIDINSRRELKDLVEVVDGTRKALEQINATETARRNSYRLFQEGIKDIIGAEQQLALLRNDLIAEADRVRWKEHAEPLAEDSLCIRRTLSDIRYQVQSSIKLATSDTLVSSPHVTSLRNRFGALEQNLASITAAQDAVHQIRAQREAVATLISDLESISLRLNIPTLQANVSTVPSTTDCPDVILSWREDIAAVSSDLTKLVADVHLRIPFLCRALDVDSSTTPMDPNLLPFEFADQDSSVKRFINILIVRTCQTRDEMNDRLDRFERICLQREEKEEEKRAFDTKFASQLSLAQTTALPDAAPAPAKEEETQIIPSSDTAASPDVFGSLSSKPFDSFGSINSPKGRADPVVAGLPSDQARIQEWLANEAKPLLSDTEKIDDLDGSPANLGNAQSKLRKPLPAHDLAKFSEKVESADAALSDLLDSIDAANPGSALLPPPSLSLTVLTMSEAIIQASNAVSAVRLAAIPLDGDRSVKLAVERIEESWTEMMLMAEDVRPRAGSAASSTSSSRSTCAPSLLRASRRISSRQSTSLSMSRSSSSSSTASMYLTHRRPSTRPSTPAFPHDSSSLRRTTSRTSSVASISDRSEDAMATPRRRATGSRIPLSTPRRDISSSLPPITPTTARPFSFSSRTHGTRAPSSIPLRDPTSTPRTARRGSSRSTSKGEPIAVDSNLLQRSTSYSSRASSTRPDSLTSSASSRRSSGASSTYRRPSLSPENLSRIGYRSSPPRHRRLQYRANLSNKLDREVGSIVNALDIHVPIEMADGSWSDESGMYKIGGKVYFCRILRSKNVMVRVGGGWLNLLQFIMTHFAPAETINISPTTPVKRTLKNEPRWISSPVIRDQLKPTQPLSSPIVRYSTDPGYLVPDGRQGASNRSLSESIPMHRSFSSSTNISTPLRKSFGSSSSLQSLFSPPVPQSFSSRQQSAQRPPIPAWRP